MADNKNKVKQRNGQRIYCRNLMKNAVEVLNNYDPSLESKLVTLQKSLLERLDTIETLDNDILEKIEDEGKMADEIASAGDFRQQTQEVITRISLLFEKVRTKEKEDHSSVVAVVPTERSGHSAKLPKLSIRPFTGDPAKFQEFWDSFSSAVGQNASLDDVTKFNYLRVFIERSSFIFCIGSSPGSRLLQRSD